MGPISPRAERPGPAPRRTPGTADRTRARGGDGRGQPTDTTADADHGGGHVRRSRWRRAGRAPVARGVPATGPAPRRVPAAAPPAPPAPTPRRRSRSPSPARAASPASTTRWSCRPTATCRSPAGAARAPARSSRRSSRRSCGRSAGSPGAGWRPPAARPGTPTTWSCSSGAAPAGGPARLDDPGLARLEQPLSRPGGRHLGPDAGARAAATRPDRCRTPARTHTTAPTPRGRRCRGARVGQPVVTEVSSTTKLVCSEASSVIRNFTVTVLPLYAVRSNDFCA